jgi:hypothetical protein
MARETELQTSWPRDPAEKLEGGLRSAELLLRSTGLAALRAAPGHTWRDTCPSAVPAFSPWTHTTPEYPPLPAHWIHDHWDPCHCPCRTPASSWSHSSPGYSSPQVHHPTGPAEPQLCVGWLDPHPSDFPCPSDTAGFQLHEEQLEPHTAGTGTSLAWDSRIHQPANPTPWVERPQLYRLPS